MRKKNIIRWHYFLFELTANREMSIGCMSHWNKFECTKMHTKLTHTHTHILYTFTHSLKKMWLYHRHWMFSHSIRPSFFFLFSFIYVSISWCMVYFDGLWDLKIAKICSSKAFIARWFVMAWRVRWTPLLSTSTGQTTEYNVYTNWRTWTFSVLCSSSWKQHKNHL